ncbi:MAG: nucleotidyl transferase AbiEii/AbiGii toxin family protein [Melioribacteraceae bacterium]|nr:nucleotidyl transferase AbiEii/AbiGii toxin family protein [Melioribacteraceae bacterium]
MILALHLVEELCLENLEFIFKGGTAFSVLYNEPFRFSIDVDIITKNNKEELEVIFSKILKSSNFNRFEFDLRRNLNNIPKYHYKFFYKSAIDEKESYILLDVLLEENSYPELIEKEISNVFILTDGNKVKVKLPTIESITGDKLTAFAPNTIGVRYNTSKHIEIIKQLFDVGYLFDSLTHFEIVAISYRRIAEKEIQYRKLNINIEQALQDTIETALILGRRSGNKDDNQLKYNELIKGIGSFQSYTIANRFYLDTAIECAAKGALLAAKILKNNHDYVSPIEQNIDFKKYLINNIEYNFLNKLIKIPNNALYYWYEAIKLLN